MAQAKLELLLELKNKLKAGLAGAKAQITNELKGLKGQVTEFANKNMEAFSAIKDQVPGLGSALKLLSNPYALITAAVVGFSAAALASTNMALDWEKSLAKVNVTAQQSPKDLARLSDQILHIGANSGVALETVPEAFNRIISAGLDVNTSLQVLGPTLKAVKAGFTDAETVAAAAVGVMNSSGRDINYVYDTLFATLNKGNVEFKDIAQYLPKIIPGARQAGFELGETAGSFALLTAKGFSAEQATTGLMNVFKSFSDPKYIDGFKKIGVNVFDSAGKARGIVPIITDLKKSLSGLTSEQVVRKLDLVGLDRDAVGSFAVMTQNIDDLKSTIEFTTNSQGQLDEAFKNSKTSTDGWAGGMNKLKAVAIQFGQLFLPLVAKTGEGFDWASSKVLEFVDWIKQLYRESVLFQDIISGIGATFKIIWAIAIGGLKLLKDGIVWLNNQLDVTGKIGSFFGFLEDVWVRLRVVAAGVINVFRELFGVITPLGDALANVTNPKKFVEYLGKAKEAFANFDVSGAYNRGADEKALEIKRMKEEANAKNPASSLTPGATNPDTTAAGNTTPENNKSIVGEAAQKRVINVTIQALHQGNNIIQQDAAPGAKTPADYEKFLEEIFLRMIRGVEAAY